MKKLLILAALLCCAFLIGTVAENNRLYRNECVRLGGAAGALYQCSFQERYSSMKMGALSRLCPNPDKAWYIYNDADTRWRHKCA